jgi:hypothetical protein
MEEHPPPTVGRRTSRDPATAPRAEELPELSVCIPVNAAADLDVVQPLLRSLASYGGTRRVEVVLAVNNFPPGRPPPIGPLRALGARVVTVPDAWRSGEIVCLSARMHAVRAARGEAVVLLDADCVVRDVTALLDWYAAQLVDGDAGAAYSRVGFSDVPPLWSVRCKIAIHHMARAGKRVLLRIPTARGSNYAAQRDLLLTLYDRALLADDFNVGPTVRAAGYRVAYSRSSRLVVQTSARTFRGGWGRLARQLRYRLLYNIRMLPVATSDARYPYHRGRSR